MSSFWTMLRLSKDWKLPWIFQHWVTNICKILNSGNQKTNYQVELKLLLVWVLTLSDCYRLYLSHTYHQPVQRLTIFLVSIAQNVIKFSVRSSMKQDWSISSILWLKNQRASEPQFLYSKPTHQNKPKLGEIASKERTPLDIHTIKLILSINK